jgi:dolichol-phosphate mannosyltransferase
VTKNENFKQRLPIITVVIPSYQGEALLPAVLSKIPDFVRHIVVVDDCSIDGTRDVVKSWPDRRVHLVCHSENRGVGETVLTGYDVALKLKAEIIVKMDSDDQMDPNYLVPLIIPILEGKADYTKGNRFVHVKELKQMPFLRYIGNIALSFFTKLASGYWNIFDPTNGYTAIHASLVPRIDRKYISKRYFFESSMLIELGILRGVIQDVYVPARYRGEHSYLSKARALIEFPWRLARGCLRRLWLQHFVRDFGLFSVLSSAGLLMFLFGMSFGIYHWIHSAQLGRETPTGTVMLAVLPIILGIEFLLHSLIFDIQNVPTEPLQNYIHSNEASLEKWILSNPKIKPK